MSINKKIVLIIIGFLSFNISAKELNSPCGKINVGDNCRGIVYVDNQLLKDIVYGKNELKKYSSNYINTSNVTDMKFLFVYNKEVEYSIEDWDFSNVIDASHMFYQNTTFNQDISGWVLSSHRILYKNLII